MSRYAIEENGFSGAVEVHDDRLVRTQKGRDGRDDVATIPMDAVVGVGIDRKDHAADEVTLQVGLTEYHWKVKRADAFLEELHRIRFVTATLTDRGRHRW